MTSVDVEILINEEIKDQLHTSNLHGIYLPDCLVRPLMEDYTSSLDPSANFRLWTVLIEKEDGYRICYNEDESIFGLGIRSGNGQLVCLGYYGTFLNTLKAM